MELIDIQINDHKQLIRKQNLWRRPDSHHRINILKFKIKKCRLRKFDFIKLDIPSYDVIKLPKTNEASHTLKKIKRNQSFVNQACKMS